MIACHDLRAAESPELRPSHDEVLLPVCLEHVGDGQVVLARELQVLLEVTSWIHHEADALHSQQIGVVRDARRLDRPEEPELASPAKCSCLSAHQVSGGQGGECDALQARSSPLGRRSVHG